MGAPEHVPTDPTTEVPLLRVPSAPGRVVARGASRRGVRAPARRRPPGHARAGPGLRADAGRPIRGAAAAGRRGGGGRCPGRRRGRRHEACRRCSVGRRSSQTWRRAWSCWGFLDANVDRRARRRPPGVVRGGPPRAPLHRPCAGWSTRSRPTCCARASTTSRLPTPRAGPTASTSPSEPPPVLPHPRSAPTPVLFVLDHEYRDPARTERVVVGGPGRVAVRRRSRPGCRTGARASSWVTISLGRRTHPFETASPTWSGRVVPCRAMIGTPSSKMSSCSL